MKSENSEDSGFQGEEDARAKLANSVPNQADKQPDYKHVPKEKANISKQTHKKSAIERESTV